MARQEVQKSDFKIKLSVALKISGFWFASYLELP